MCFASNMASEDGVNRNMSSDNAMPTFAVPSAPTSLSPSPNISTFSPSFCLCAINAALSFGSCLKKHCSAWNPSDMSSGKSFSSSPERTKMRLSVNCDNMVEIDERKVLLM